MKKSPAFPFGAGSRLLLVVVGLFLCLAAATPTVGGEPAFEPPPELDIVDFRLDNGLSVVVAVRPDLRLAAANLTVDFGSVDEPPGYSGMAHILEHVTLAGSRRIGSLDLEAELRALDRLDRAFVAQRTARAAADTTREQAVALAREVALASEAVSAAGEKGEILGGRLEARGAIGLNATTSPDATQYFTRIPSEELGYWLELEADRLRHPILRRFYSEQEVVLREIDTLTGGKPTAQERLLGEIFGSAPVANPVAGRPDQIETFDRSTAFDFFHRYYRPENIAIAIVGDVDPGEIRELCERHFGSWQPTPVEETSAAASGEGSETASAVLDEPFVRGYNSTRSPLVFLGFPSAEPGSVEEAAHLAIAALFASEELSPLEERFVRREPLVWSSGASPHYPSEKVDGLFLVHLYGQAGVDHRFLVEEAGKLLPTLGGLDDRDLAGGLALARMELIAGLEDPSRLASSLALHQAIHDDWTLPFARLDQLSRLRPAKLRALAGEIFDLEGAEHRWPKAILDGGRTSP